MSNSEPKLGVALTKCFFCGEDDKIVLNTRLTKKHAESVEEMHGKVLDMEPCPKCKGFMDQGIILMTFDPEKSDKDWNKAKMPNPYRTGGFFVVKEEACEKFMSPDMFKYAQEHRWMFIEHQAAIDLGLFQEVK